MAADIAQTAGASSFPRDFIVFNGALYFSATDGNSGIELWKWNGSSATIIQDIAPGSDSSSPQDLTIFGGWLYFLANDQSSGDELWRTDGTRVERLNDIYPGTGSGFVGF
jgi:ELWxxDGT repeat protein